MFGWTSRPRYSRPIGREFGSIQPTYRVAIRRHTAIDAHDLHLYGGGDYSPYCIESLIDMLRGEAHTARGDYEVTFEFVGPCSASTLEEVAYRLLTAGIPGLRGVVRAEGHRALPLDAPQMSHASERSSIAPPRSS
jgi:hypothetical protein